MVYPQFHITAFFQYERITTEGSESNGAYYRACLVIFITSPIWSSQV